MALPRIVLTSGDPAGIGPEICRKAARHPDVQKKCRLIIMGPPNRRFRMGRPSAEGGRLSGEFIRDAVRLALNGDVDAIVTAPINKISFALGGWGKKYTGHTEMLAALTGAKKVALMLASGPLRAVHVTSHIPLQEVSRSLSVSRVLDTIRLAHSGLTFLGFRRPRIGVSALNPHGGEEGLLGKEEQVLIKPAVRKAKALGLNVTGPLSSDVLWPRVLSEDFNVGIAMYHDQGQIPIKLHGFENKGRGKLNPGGINITLGLPIVRTSPAHGTAYDIAGKGVASEKSLVQAIMAAVEIVRRKKS